MDEVDITRKCANGRFCDILSQRCEIAGHSGKGLVYLATYNIKTEKERVVGVYYKKSSTDRGLMLNYCPFCGEKILWIEERKHKKEKKDVA